MTFTAPSYASGWPQLGFELRHRQVTAGRVVYDKAHIVQVTYDIGMDRFKLTWWPVWNSGHAAEVPTDFRRRIDPERPAGPDNPEFTVDNLDAVLAALKPMADAFRRPPK